MRRFIYTAVAVYINICVYANNIEHVIFIGIDGLSSASLPYADMPIVNSLMETGSYTLGKRAVRPTSSSPNWSSMFMGVPVEIHGYTTATAKEPEIPSPIRNHKNNIFPTIFQIIKNERPDYKIGCIYEWSGIKYLVDTLSCDYHAYRSGGRQRLRA